MAPDPSTDTRKRRSSFFGIKQRAPPPLTPLTNRSDHSEKTAKLQKKKSRFSSPWSSSTDLPEEKNGRPLTPVSSRPPSTTHSSAGSLSAGSQRGNGRPSLSKKAGRPASIFGSLKSLRFAEEDDTPPQTATSTSSSIKSPSTAWSEFGMAEELTEIGRSRVVLHSGPVTITSKWFMNKKEYLVLTETHLVRFKNHSKAVEAYPCIQSAPSRANIQRHASSRSVDSTIAENQSFGSDNSGDRDHGIPLSQVLAVHLPEEDRPQNILEVAYLENDASQGTFLSLTFSRNEERDVWLQVLRNAANKVRLMDPEPVSQALSEYAARVVEREEDYDLNSFRIYKVLKRVSARAGGRVSADDTAKVGPFVCLLVIGVHKVHLIQLPKSALRGSTPSLTDLGEGQSYGILTTNAISISGIDDTFSLGFRFPFQKPKSFLLASLAALEIGSELKARDKALRPEWTVQPFLFNSPVRFEDDALRSPSMDASPGDHDWSVTLTAFCVAYGVDPSMVCYSIDYDTEDAPRFVLFPPSRVRREAYLPVELVAILRSLRYNESFGSLDFSNVSLDCLNGLYDLAGQNHLCQHQKSGAPVGIPFEEQAAASVLVTEIRALAVSNRKLRRVDLSGSITQHVLDPSRANSEAEGCSVFEALYPVCCKQNTNVDWFCVNGIPLVDRDLDYLISLAANRVCHVRGLELSSCSLTDHSFQLILDTLKAQTNTLEALVLSGNSNRIRPSMLSRSLDAFEFICKLDLSRSNVSADPEPLLGIDTLRRWRLKELILAETHLNDESVRDICSYLSHKQSEPLKLLNIAGCGLSGGRVADLMEAATIAIKSRLLLLDASSNPLASQGHDRLVTAIRRSRTPTHVALCQYDYPDEENFQDLLYALAENKSVRALHLARVSLPGAATDITIHAMEELLANNSTLEELDISGEESRLDVTRFGPGLIQALSGLKRNKSLISFRVDSQKLGLQGAGALAEMIRDNSTLKYLHCDHNEISMSGFVDICNAVQLNRTLLYVPSLEEGRDLQLKQLEHQIRDARTKSDGTAFTPPNKVSSLRKYAKIGGLDVSRAYQYSKKTPPVPQWTQQDEQHAYRMIADGWEEHIRRLHQYLDRNNRLANGEAVDEGEFEMARPATAGSLSNILEKVAIESTPRAERQLGFDADGAPIERSPTVSGSQEMSEREGGSSMVPSKYLQRSVPSGALVGPSSTLAPPPAFLSSKGRSLSSNSATSTTSATSPSLREVDIDQTPIFERRDPFASIADNQQDDSADEPHTPTHDGDSSSISESSASPGFVMKIPSTKGRRGTKDT